MAWLTAGQAVTHAGLKGRLMKLSPLMPWRAGDLHLVIGVRSAKKDWRTRTPVIDTIHIQSGQACLFEIDAGFALTLFSSKGE